MYTRELVQRTAVRLTGPPPCWERKLVVSNEPIDQPPQDHGLASTADLLQLVHQGDRRALNRLFAIFSPLLTRWAHGRLPTSARGLSDTDDLVQITLLRVLEHVDTFEARRPGAFLAYLRRSLLNNLRNEIRRAKRRPAGEPPAGELGTPGPSPIEKALGARAVDAYEEALEKLNEEQRAAVILRIELGCKHREIADLLGSPSPNAARMLISRALVRLADLIDEDVVRDGT